MRHPDLDYQLVESSLLLCEPRNAVEAFAQLNHSTEALAAACRLSYCRDQEKCDYARQSVSTLRRRIRYLRGLHARFQVAA